MNTTFQNIAFIIIAGILLMVGVFILRFVLKFAWKLVRAALLILSVVMIAGYFLGFFELVF